MRVLRHISILFVLLLSISAKSQIYPVTSTVIVTPPYSPYLPDYADPLNNQLQVLLTLTDFAVPQYEVKLKLRIEGEGYTLTSKDVTNLPSFTLTPGVPLQVTGSDFNEYLNSNNLDFSGLSQSEYDATEMLPEGAVSFCIDIVDANNPSTVLSNQSCAIAWLARYNPPMLNVPICGQEIVPTDPQAILFSWTPLHMNSPHGPATEYIFSLYEIRPDDSDPNLVVSTNPPIETITTTNTFVNYGILNNSLLEGMEYVWRVQAKDPLGRDLFLNNGYSEICTFQYGNPASALLEGVTLTLESNGTGQTVGSAWWNGSDLFDSYKLEVRKTGNDSYQWFPYETTDISEKMYKLEPETEYECRVKGVANGAETDWSNTSVFTTNPERDYSCGDGTQPGRPAQIIPLDALLPGMKVQTGQFIMTIVLAEPLPNKPGHFKGTGKVPITFLATANVEFDDILVDDNLIHHEGRIDVMTEGVEEWLNNYDNIYIEGTVSEYQSNNQDSTVIFYLNNGPPLTFDWPPDGETLTIIDESGMVYTVMPDGTVLEAGSTTPDNDNLDATADHQIYFRPSTNQVYGFDYLKYDQWTQHYPMISLSDGSHYFVTYKSVASNEEDKVLAHIHSQTNFTPTFVTKNGIQLAASFVNDTTYEITVDDFVTSQIIYAYDEQNKKIGKCNLSVYDEKKHDVKIVVVNGADSVNVALLQTQVNDIFKQANAEFNFETVIDTFSFIYDLNGNGLDAASDGEMHKYSSEMRELRNAYFDSRGKENKLYLFVIPQIEGDMVGYMVRGKIVGFIQEQNTLDAKIYAHELAHGAFGLEHSFPRIPKQSTDNLLDYGAGEHLTHEQWYQVQHFIPTWSFLDDEEDGGMIVSGDIPIDLRNDDRSIPVLMADGGVLVLPNRAKKVTFFTGDIYVFKSTGEPTGDYGPIGALFGFQVDNTFFKYKKRNGSFNYYDKDDNPYVPEDVNDLTENRQEIIIGFPYYEQNNIGVTLYRVESTVNVTQKNFLDKYSVVEMIYGVTETGQSNFLRNYADWESLLDNNPGRKINGVFKPDLGELGKAYIEKYSQYTSSGHPLSPIIFSNALWIKKFETIEPYLMCYLNSELAQTPELDFEIEWDSKLANYDRMKYLVMNKGETTGAYGSPESALSQTDINQIVFNDGFTAYQYSDPYKEFQAYQFFLNEIESHFEQGLDGTQINSDLANASDGNEVVSILEDEGICLLEEISFDNRLKAIELLEEESEDDLIMLLFNSTLYNGQATALADALFTDRSGLFDKLWSTLDFADFHEWIQKVTELTILANSGKEYESWNLELTSGLFVFWEEHGEGTITIRRRYNADPYPHWVEGSDGTPSVSTFEFGEEFRTYDYDELIEFTFHEGDEYGLVEKDSDPMTDNMKTVLLPAFYIGYLEYNKQKEGVMELIRASVNLLAILTALPSGGSSLTALGAMTIVMSSADLLVMTIDDAIIDTEEGEDFLRFWDLITVLDGALAVTTITKGVVRTVKNGAKEFVVNIPALIQRFGDNLIANRSTADFAGAQNKFQELIVHFRHLVSELNTAQSAVYATLLEMQILMKLEAAYVSSLYKSVDNTNLFRIDNNIEAYITYQGADVKIFDLKPSSQGAYIDHAVLDQVPMGNFELVGDFKQVRFKDGAKVEVDDIAVYRNLDDNSVHLVKMTNSSGNFVEGLVNGVRRYNVGVEISNSNLASRNFVWLGSNRTITWTRSSSQSLIDFGNRSNLRNILGISDPANEAHHIITWTKGGQHKVVQKAAFDGFHLNIPENGISLPKFKLSTGEGTHSSHKAYDDYVVKRLDDFHFSKNEIYSPNDANQFLQKQLIPELETLIKQADESLLSLNEYFKQIINPNVVPGY